MNPIYVTDLGFMAYEAAWRLQRNLVRGKQAGVRTSDHLLLVEHPPVITVGRHGDERHILAGADRLRHLGVPVLRVERGGDVTYHGPGQLVVYPILDLRRFGRDVRGFVARLLSTVAAVLTTFGVPAEVGEGRATGVWVLPQPNPTTGSVAPKPGRPAKIAALGVRIERWVTYHGLALNVAPDLAAFRLIVPCGLPGSDVTSLSAVLERPVTLAEVKPILVAAFGRTFEVPVAELPARALAVGL